MAKAKRLPIIMVALPGQLFYSTQIPACLWFLARDRSGRHSREGWNPVSFRDRRGEVLFIDARKLGRMADRTHHELTDEDIARIAGTYHAWRGESIIPSPSMGEGKGEGAGIYADIPGFRKSATIEEIRKHDHVRTPGRYVGAEAVEDDGEPFAGKMKRLTEQLKAQMAEGRKLDAAIEANLKELGYDN